MFKFKAGDEVRRTSCFDENIASGRYFRGEAFKIAMVNYNGGIVDPDGMTHGPQYLEHVAETQHPIKSPIRTVTRRELVEWSDDVLSIVPDGKDRVFIGFKHPVETQFASLSSDQLRSVLMVVSQIVEFLDEDKGDE